MPSSNTISTSDHGAKIIPEAKGLGTELVVYSGGEPLRYAHIKSALETTKSFQIRTVIFTTGTDDPETRLPVSQAHWKELAKLGLAGARFSVYAGPSQREFHNHVVQAKPRLGDAFGVNEESIRRELSSGVPAELNFVPSEQTAESFHEIYAWAAHLGCKALHLLFPTLQGRNYINRLLAMSPPTERLLKQVVLSLPASQCGPAIHISRFSQQRWQLRDTLSCPANPEQLIIRTDGTISPCNACKYVAGDHRRENVLSSEANLSELWAKNTGLVELRR